MPNDTPRIDPPTIDAVLRRATAQLIASGQPDAEARADAGILLCTALDCPRTTLYAFPERVIPDAALDRFDALLKARIAGQPVAYLLGRREFWSRDLTVDDRVLIPRPDTELLVEAVLDLRPGNAHVIVDAGTGSGAIAIALAVSCDAEVVATDRSGDALAVAATNIACHCPGRVQLWQGDWLAALASRSVDIVASNPPYIAAGDAHLGNGDLRFEPHSALVSGGDGLDDIRVIAADARRVLRTGGTLLLEHGYDQGQAVRAILARCGFADVITRRDLAGLERVTGGRHFAETTGSRA